MTIHEDLPRKLSDRSGRHLCTRCLREVNAEDYFRFDHSCEACAAEDDGFPLASTPEKASPETGKSE